MFEVNLRLLPGPGQLMLDRDHDLDVSGGQGATGITIPCEFTLPALMTVVSERQPQWSRATTGENRIVAAWRWDGGEAVLG